MTRLVASGSLGPTLPAVVAFGGGHGLAASLTALRRVTDHLTAIVTVADRVVTAGCQPTAVVARWEGVTFPTTDGEPAVATTAI